MLGESRSLDDWLAYVETQHHRAIDLSLDRVRTVADRLGVLRGPRSIVVGGTNGKGSTCAYLEHIFLAAGYRVGKYASPHLLRFSERIRLNGAAADDARLLPAFERVQAARQGLGLTYFEFTTLVALDVFARANLDLMILEIGLGGRLDAVNIVDATCSVLTSVGLDHQEWLGPTRESIGWEKAHIFRAGRPAICTEPDVPATVIDYAASIGAPLYRYQQDFHARLSEPPLGSGVRRQWDYLGWQAATLRPSLPLPALRGPHQVQNAAGALAAVEALQDCLPVDQQAVRQGLMRTQLPGRFQVLPGLPVIILDVAHNPHAACALAAALADHRAVMPESPDGMAGRTLAVFGMLRDKDADGVIHALVDDIDHWYLASTRGDRGLAADALGSRVIGVAQVHEKRPFVVQCDDVAQALQRARADARANDRIAVFGSFTVVADAMRSLEITAQ